MGLNDNLDIDQLGLNTIAKHEGNVLHPYQDISNLWTIGVGHLITPNDSFSSVDNSEVKKMLLLKTKQNPNPYRGRQITKEESLEILHRDVQKCVKAIRQNVQMTPLNQNMFNALCSFLFNVGTGWIVKGGVKKALDAGDYTGAAGAMLAFSKAKVNGVVQTIPGLYNRRVAEVQLFCSPVVPEDEIEKMEDVKRDVHLESVGYASDRLTCQDAGRCHDIPLGEKLS